MALVHVKVVRKFLPHSMLLDAAWRALEAGEARERGYWYDWLSALLYCSLSVEAIANTYGETLVPKWSDFESSSPHAKIRIVAEHCGLKPDFGVKPWSVVPQLIKFRNSIAHARPETVKVDEMHPVEDYQNHLYSKPLGKLERCVTKKSALQSYNYIKEILQLFANVIAPEQLMDLEIGAWASSASVVSGTE